MGSDEYYSNIINTSSGSQQTNNNNKNNNNRNRININNEYINEYNNNYNSNINRNNNNNNNKNKFLDYLSISKGFLINECNVPRSKLDKNGDCWWLES